MIPAHFLTPQQSNQIDLDIKVAALNQALLRCAQAIQANQHDPNLLINLIDQYIALEIDLFTLKKDTSPMNTAITLDHLDDGAKTKTPPTKNAFKPSPYQQAVFDAVTDTRQNLCIKAVAGSGKTTTTGKAAALLSPALKIKFMVFSKANALEMQAKMPSFVSATTAHSAGFGDLRRAYKGIKVDERKFWNLLKARYSYDDDVQANAGVINNLVSLCKNTLREPTEDNLDWLCDRFGIMPNGSADVVYPAVARLYQDSLDISDRVIDFDDMVFLPAIGQVTVARADVLFVDEQQDTNAAQQAYYLKVADKARMIFVGDPNQAIFGFRGADTDAMDNMTRATNPLQLPLSICYRCPGKVVALAQAIVPQIKARDGAPDGIVADLALSQLTRKVQRGDMVLCRLNAPLVKPAFALIRNGIKAVIRGRDIGKNLITLVKKAQKQAWASDLPQTLVWLSNYVDREEMKLLSLHKDNQAQMLRDQLETILALSDDCQTISELETRIDTVFSDDVAGVVFSSVHKAKGLESDRVFILQPQLLNPQKWDKKDWQIAQLANLKYVAITRAMQELYFVNGD